MKAHFGIFRIISIMLTLIILCQSCTVYRYKNISINEAIETKSKVRVKTTSNKNYVFNKIEKNEEIVYGIANKNSKEVRQLVDQIIPESASENKVKIRLVENSIEEINPKNKTLSVLVPIGVVIASFILLGSALTSIAPGK
ncbi:hypothetical protein BH23BAC2_BH23BAC2_26570 [soil metagenome]